MEFDIDVSGEDLLSKDYTICIASEKIIRGYKITTNFINIINSKFGQGIYKYDKSQKGKANLKVRIYCLALYYLFKSIYPKIKDKKIILNICRDFSSKENQIKLNIQSLLVKNLKLNLDIDDLNFSRLDPKSNAHRYSYLMRMDFKNQFKENYVNIRIEDIEKYLIKE